MELPEPYTNMVSPKKLETGLRSNSAGIPGFPLRYSYKGGKLLGFQRLGFYYRLIVRASVVGPSALCFYSSASAAKV